MTRLLAAYNAEQAEPAWPSMLEAPVNVEKSLIESDAPDDVYMYWPT